MPFTTNVIGILGLALSALFGRGAIAQAPGGGPALQIGARVRVSSSAPGFAGPGRVANLLAQHGDTLSLLPEGTQDSVALALGSITQLEVSAGRGSHVGQGIGLGFLTGALAGVAIGALTYTPSSCSSSGLFCPVDLGSGASAAAGGVLGGLLGMFVGAIIGAARQTENWERVTVTARKVGLRLAPSDKRGLMASATF